MVFVPRPGFRAIMCRSFLILQRLSNNLIFLYPDYHFVVEMCFNIYLKKHLFFKGWSLNTKTYMYILGQFYTAKQV